MDENKNIDPKMKEALEGIWGSLTEEQKEKAKKCKSWDELTVLAGKEGIELPDEVLDAVAGGYIIGDTGSYDGYMVLDDTGRVLSEVVHGRDKAIERAKKLGQSTEEIGLYQWAKIKGAC